MSINSLSNQTGGMARSIMELVLGFLVAAAVTLLIGFAVVYVLRLVAPNWSNAWAHGSVSAKLGVVLPGILLSLACCVYLWRRRKYAAIGVLLYVLVDLATVLA